jgi:hypothetical protein
LDVASWITHKNIPEIPLFYSSIQDITRYWPLLCILRGKAISDMQLLKLCRVVILT